MLSSRGSRLLGGLWSGLSGRSGRIAAQAVVLTAVVGGTVAYANSGQTFLLSVDGHVQQVQADAKTVRALLADEAIPVSDRDLVAPSLDSPLVDGQQVVVRYARPLTVSLDGVPRTYWTTALTLDSALSSLGIRAANARLSVSRSLPLGRTGLALSVSTPKSVTIAADGSTSTVTTTAPTVADLLAERHVTLGALDTLSVMQAAPVVDGMMLAVTRIEKKTVTQVENIAAPASEHKVATLTVGQRKVVTPGKPGSRRAVYDVVVANGKIASRSLVSATVSEQPVPAVVQVGTKPKAGSDPATVVGTTGGSGSSAGATTGTKADSLNWAALAKCESGGNPRAVNPAGYYGLYQFSLSTWHAQGGKGNPIDASPAEQLLRAKILYNKAGAGQWGCGRHLFD